MAVPSSIRVPVDSAFVFPHGAMFVGVEASTDFDLRGKVEDDQARDRESGLRIWLVTVIDMDQLRQVQEDEGGGFRRPAEVKVKVVSEQRPVPPRPQVAGYGALVEFEGLMLTPYPDSAKCRAPHAGREHRCGARLAWSMKATGIKEFAGLASSRA
jgi:hypothetical protein